MWWVGQLNNYVPCSFVLDDDTTFLRKYAATLEASFAIPHPQIESTAWSADQECKPFYKNAACIRYKIFTTNFCFSVALYAFDVSFITGEKGRSFRWVVSGRQGKLASAPVYRCLRFLGLKGAHCFLRRRSCKHSLICEVVEELLHGVGETVHPAPKVVKRRTIWSTAALIFGPSCTLGRAGFS